MQDRSSRAAEKAPRPQQLTVANSQQDKKLEDSQHGGRVDHGFGDQQQMQLQGCCSLGGNGEYKMLLQHRKYTTPVK